MKTPNKKQAILTTVKYIGCFLATTLCFWLIIKFIGYLDREKMEMIECFLFEDNSIKKAFDYKSYLQGACHFSSGKCDCFLTPDFLLAFYLLSLPIFALYDLVRRKIVNLKYGYFCVLSEIIIWTAVYYFAFGVSPYVWYSIRNTYSAIAPLAIIVLTFHILPLKILKIVTAIIGVIYSVWFLYWFVMVLLNFL